MRVANMIASVPPRVKGPTALATISGVGPCSSPSTIVTNESGPIMRNIVRSVVGAAITTAGIVAATGLALAAETETVVTRTPIAETTTGLVCVEEPVFLEGEIQTTFHLTENSAGHVTFVQASTYKGLKGTGVLTGQKYRIVGTPFGNTIINSNGPFPLEQTRVTTANVIGQGQPNPGPVFRILILEHFTVNANGEVTAEVVEFREECL